MAIKRIYELDTELAILDEDMIVFDRELSPGVIKTFKTSALALKNYVNDLAPPTDLMLVETADFFLYETGDSVIL